MWNSWWSWVERKNIRKQKTRNQNKLTETGKKNSWRARCAWNIYNQHIGTCNRHGTRCRPVLSGDCNDVNGRAWVLNKDWSYFVRGSFPYSFSLFPPSTHPHNSPHFTPTAQPVWHSPLFNLLQADVLWMIIRRKEVEAHYEYLLLVLTHTHTHIRWVQVLSRQQPTYLGEQYWVLLRCTVFMTGRNPSTRFFCKATDETFQPAL